MFNKPHLMVGKTKEKLVFVTQMTRNNLQCFLHFYCKVPLKFADFFFPFIPRGTGNAVSFYSLKMKRPRWQKAALAIELIGRASIVNIKY